MHILPKKCEKWVSQRADAEGENQARRAIRKHGFYTPAVAAGNRTAPPISKGSRRPLTKSGMVCKATKGYALHEWMTGRKSPLLIHPTTNGEDNLQDPQPTPDPGAAFLHRPLVSALLRPARSTPFGDGRVCACIREHP